MFQRLGGAAYNKDLTRTQSLAAIIGNPQQDLRFIHVAGTNGKGSVSHMLAAMFQSAGYKTGLYTSPHLTDFRERIRVGGKYIPEQSVLDFVNENQANLEPIQSSFFEWTFVLALDHFRNSSCDIVILETGMGGRLDSTNIVNPELSLITNIGLDHMKFLGNTKAAIAKEKAGIIKQNVPVLIGRRDIETISVFEHKALETDSPIAFAEDSITTEWIDFETLQLADESSTFRLSPGLKGDYQSENIALVWAAYSQLKDSFDISLQDIIRGIEEVQSLFPLKGRWQTIQKNPTLICETAHNKEGIENALGNLSAYSYHTLRLVMGVVEDKSEELFDILPVNAKFYLSAPDIPRALSIEKISDHFKRRNLNFQAARSIESALKKALDQADQKDLIMVFGSIFTIAEALSYLESSENSK